MKPFTRIFLASSSFSFLTFMTALMLHNRYLITQQRQFLRTEAISKSIEPIHKLESIEQGFSVPLARVKDDQKLSIAIEELDKVATLAEHAPRNNKYDSAFSAVVRHFDSSLWNRLTRDSDFISERDRNLLDGSMIDLALKSHASGDPSLLESFDLGKRYENKVELLKTVLSAISPKDDYSRWIVVGPHHRVLWAEDLDWLAGANSTFGLYRKSFLNQDVTQPTIIDQALTRDEPWIIQGRNIQIPKVGTAKLFRVIPLAWVQGVFPPSIRIYVSDVRDANPGPNETAMQIPDGQWGILMNLPKPVSLFDGTTIWFAIIASAILIGLAFTMTLLIRDPLHSKKWLDQLTRVLTHREGDIDILRASIEHCPATILVMSIDQGMPRPLFASPKGMAALEWIPTSSPLWVRNHVGTHTHEKIEVWTLKPEHERWLNTLILESQVDTRSGTRGSA